MTYRFYITIGSSQVEVHPLNFMKTSLVDAQDEGEIFYRRKFNGTLRFIGDDFDLFYMVESVEPCTEMFLLIEQKDSGADTYHTYWEGRFSTMDGRFDLDNCFFEVTPKPYDSYSSFDKDADTEYNIIVGIATTATAKTYDAEYDNCRWLEDVIEYILSQIEPGATYQSTFFQNATNPVTLDTNKYRYLMIAQKSDIKRPAATNPASMGMLSWNGLMSILRMYNVFWTFDGTTVRIEHYDYWSSSAGLNLTTQALAKKSNKYSYLRDNMNRQEKFNFMEWGNRNFGQHVISYSANCTEESIYEYKNNVTTDVDFIYKCANSLSDLDPSLVTDEGWVILATYPSGGDNLVYYGTAYEDPAAAHNYVNSWSYLLYNYFMHGRVLIEGKINGVDMEFISARRTKSQSIAAIVCHEDGYDPNDYITTELGETWLAGQKGYVKEATIHPDGRVEFNLLYGEDRNETPSPVTKYKTLHCVVDLPRYVDSYLSEPNIVDTYYTVLFDEGTETEECLEILIPAGTVHQQDIADVEHTTVDGIYTEHSSLSGWIFVYNDNETWTEIADCGSPPAPPASPPAATTCYPPTQADQWDCVEVGWLPIASASYYEVYRSIDGGVYEYVIMLPSTETTFTDCESSNHDYRPATFCYKIKACNAAGCSDFSNEECVEVNTA